MLKQSTFTNHAHTVVQFLEQAKSQIDIAVCWFSHPWIFSVLKKKIEKGCAVRLLVQFDQANFHPKGLPFFDLKGEKIEIRVWQNGLLHHKFAIADKRILLTGSYNWTGTQHADNVLLLKEKTALASFEAEFERLWGAAMPLRLLAKVPPPPPAFHALFEPILWDISDLRQAILRGAKVWLAIFRENEMHIWAECLRQQRHFLRGANDFFEKNKSTWNLEAFETWLQTCNTSQKRLFQQYCLTMQADDVLIAAKEDGTYLAIGMVGAAVEASVLPKYGFARYVQWFECPEQTKAEMMLPKRPFGRFYGSGLRAISFLDSKSKG